MNPLIKRLAHEASAPLEEMLQRLIRAAALIALATGCAIAASAFFTVDLFLYLQRLWGSLIAAASVAALYLIGALIFLLIAMRRPKKIPGEDAAPQPVAAAALMAAPIAAKAPLAPPPNPEFAAKIDAAVVPLLGVLREAGREKEVLALEAGAEIAKQLKPPLLMAIALCAGIFLGRTLNVKRPLT
jgi:O-antigen/teichoic acid export membrane protein